ncbi:hypothetical protein [Methylobacterium aerolatum]|uniref:Uncharacterized protein n=1 Tax=Methylobacterium aerolatum TaxID=418708 RepID=A0ABU0I381_9HYPH|nr:hypothetical protein [Methylobacterium aerolatum]MDQ0449061.1 hypothetical protein [Methylobacterium aerolatum]GJD35249.1 hypothetical protein FMGBMHLM_2158 [Methylobacterium aerolatum]
MSDDDKKDEGQAGFRRDSASPGDKQQPENKQENLNERLDEALEETFPSSDPVSVKITK